MLSKLDSITSNFFLKPDYRLLRHLLILIAIGLISVNVLWDEPTQILPDRYGIWAIYFSLFAIVIYANMYGLIPKLLLQGKTKQYVIGVTLLMLFFLVSVGMLQSTADDNSIPLRTPPLIGISSGFATFFLFIAGLTALQFFKYRIKNQEKINQLENATMAVELSNLQDQINPHFLFNMLNNANVMIEEDAQQSGEILSRLNGLLRYQVEKSAQKKVNLWEEIVFLTDYLELEKLRRDRFSYQIYTEGDMSINLPPLLFIPFVENAIKHNPENDTYVSIVFAHTGNKLRFECKNNQAKIPPQKEGGIGLINIRRRLDLLYEKKYSLELIDEKDVFTVIMEIRL